MANLTFKTEITTEDKYREFDLGVLVHAYIIEDKVVGYPTEVIVNIEAAEVDDARDVTPFHNGQDILSRLDHNTVEFLKDQAVREMQ